ncbi:MAG TPA: alpha/beta hydrolase [Lachnospiraceae bacterium]|jgi:alpha-beta hydrolase superfamily lysophospholipase|nr:alpha/beta hydrolase [Lachnospiraceae bacterium]
MEGRIVVKRNFTYRSTDGHTRIHAIEWVPEGEVRGVLQLIHGMVEYIGRYDRFARFMASHGWYVVGNDHLGHGASVISEKDYGYFGEPDGNRNVIMDIRKLHKHTKKKYPRVPYFILGHSMGSFLCRQYITRFGNDLTGAIIMGTGYQPGAVLSFGIALCRAVMKQKGAFYHSKLIYAMALGNNNARIRNPRTDSDWLTRDEAIVDAYRAHPWTHFTFTVNGYYHMFRGIEAAQKAANIRMIPYDMPLFIVSGTEDPVGAYGKGVEKVYQKYLENGLTDVRCKLYPGYRHELLNELDHEVVDRDILEWMESKSN